MPIVSRTTLQEVTQDREVQITYRELMRMLATEGVSLPPPHEDDVTALAIQTGRPIPGVEEGESAAWEGGTQIPIDGNVDVDAPLIVLTWSTKRVGREDDVAGESIKSLLERLGNRAAGQGVRLTEDETNSVVRALSVLR